MNKSEDLAQLLFQLKEERKSIKQITEFIGDTYGLTDLNELNLLVKNYFKNGFAGLQKTADTINNIIIQQTSPTIPQNQCINIEDYAELIYDNFR